MAASAALLNGRSPAVWGGQGGEGGLGSMRGDGGMHLGGRVEGEEKEELSDVERAEVRLLSGRVNE